MVERIFADQTLTACFIEGDQTRDYFACRHGLRECDRLLVENVACPGMKGNVWQPELFDATLVADAEIDALCPQACPSKEKENANDYKSRNRHAC